MTNVAELGLSLNAQDLHRAELRWGIGKGREPGRARGWATRVLTPVEIDALRLWTKLRGRRGGHEDHWCLVDTAMRAFVASPAPFILATPDRAATFATAEELVAAWHTWGDPPATFAHIDLSESPSSPPSTVRDRRRSREDGPTEARLSVGPSIPVSP